MKNRPAPQSGFAILLVLFAIILCAVLVIFLLERGTAGVKTTSAYSQASKVRSLADMAQNLILAQIRDATTYNQTTTTPLSGRDSWASQPGAIRVYNPSGGLDMIYKLYSSGTMQTTNTSLGNDVPSNWYLNPATYTDLNQPARLITASGTQITYPILDPNVITLSGSADGILNGYGITNAPVDSGTTNTAPMPVQWIYVLQDSTLCQLGDSRISGTNPIIGRIAFWADDETAKVNINTASPSGTNSYWDTPRAAVALAAPAAGNSTETQLAWYQPAQNEYNRYPGHPAMVSLPSILGTLGGLPTAQYYQLAPNYRWGGSQDSTVVVPISNVTSSRVPLLTNKQDRAYVTVDELLFQSGTIQSGTSTLLSQPTPSQVESLRFFLTSNSRAPELNLFGQPRVTIWPVSATSGSTTRTAYDNLIAFDSTIGGNAYNFVRNSPLDSAADYTGFPRNQTLYAYLQQLTSTPIPGFGGGTFITKYPPLERDQILTEIFDYIRTVNLNETYQGVPTGYQSYTPFVTGTAAGDANPSAPGAGFVVPIKIVTSSGTTQGSGRFPAIQGAALWFVQHLTLSGTNITAPAQLQAMLVLKTTTPMHGFMPWQANNLTFNVFNSNLQAQSGTVSPAVSLFSVSGSANKAITYGPPQTYDGMSPGGYDGFQWTVARATQNVGAAPQPFLSANIPVAPTDTTFSIIGGKVDVSMIVSGTVIQTYEFNFPSVANMALPKLNPYDYIASVQQPWWYNRTENYQLEPLDGDNVRDVELSHGDARLALMTPTTQSAPFPSTNYTPNQNYTNAALSFAHSMRGSTATFPYLWNSGTVGTYVNGLSYYSSGTSLTGSNATSATLSGTTVTVTSGSFAFAAHPTKYYGPDIPSNITDLQGSGWTGDFDNGVGSFPDGPFLNKPDEGADALNSAETGYSRCEWTPANGLFSPLRQIPSAVMFGSLPTGVAEGIPWRTLLFCPNPADPNHIGFTSPPDYLLLDLFRMPVVEPYAISGPVSTDGKINMNYAIAPFSYIRRACSWYALLDPLKFFAVPDSQSQVYKGGVPATLRNQVNVAQTLTQFDNLFHTNDIFHSATQICSIFLVPAGDTLSDVQNLTGGFWSTHRLTGDNSREKPYAELYPKLTTQSNTYRLHMRVQVLANSTVPPGQSDFTPLAEYRGSVLVERYLDPNNPSLVSSSGTGTVNPDNSDLNGLFQFRILQAQQFNP